MADAQSRKLPAKNVSGNQPISTPEAQGRGIVAAALLSFLKEIGGTQIWTETDLSSALNVTSSRAKEATAVLLLQGYIEPAGHADKWKVSEQGQLVSGAKSPRFTRKSIEDALAGLRDRIKAANNDRDAAYKITSAVAFGDFLGDAARVQAAEVGIRLVRKSDAPPSASAKEHAAELDFLKQLRGKTALLHVIPYEDWMSSRSHVQLL
jgi:hypothetical protein